MAAHITIFLRSQDGPFQQFLLQQNARGHSLVFLEMLHGMAAVNLFTPRAEYPRYVRSLSGIKSPVCLFVNRPLASVNAFFVETLFNEALRADCGLVSGIALDSDRQVVQTRSLFDASAVEAAGEPARDVPAVTDTFFALRRECLAAAGGLSLLSPFNMGSVAVRLSEEARRQGLRVLATSRAVATLQFI